MSDSDVEGLVFTDDEGGALRDWNRRRRIWLPSAAVAGCAGAATPVVEDIDVKTAQNRLGLADPRMTLSIYASAPASIDREAADVIASALSASMGNC